MFIDPRPLARCVTLKRNRLSSISRTVFWRSLFALIVDPRKISRGLFTKIPFSESF